MPELKENTSIENKSETVKKLFSEYEEYVQMKEEFDVLEKEGKRNTDRYYILKGKLAEEEHIESLDQLYNRLPESIPQITLIQYSKYGDDFDGYIKVLPDNRGALYKMASYEHSVHDTEMIDSDATMEMLEKSEKGIQERIEAMKVLLEVTEKIKAELEK